MQRFAFIIHPIEPRNDVSKKYPIARWMPERCIEWYIKGRDPVIMSEILGIKSLTGEETEGWFIACPLTSRQMTTLPLEFVWDKLEKCGNIALELGVTILGLGAFTSVVGDGGITLASRLPGMAVTTGNSLTVGAAVEGAKRAGELMGHSLSQSRAAVVGATGSIGAACVELLAREASEVALIGRQAGSLEKLAAELQPVSKARLKVYTDVEAGLKSADIVITVTSSLDTVIQPNQIKSGAVVCDVARPRDVSTRVAKERNDVLVIEGGVISVPGAMRLPRYGHPEREFRFGFPAGTAYACMSETMILALEERCESFTLGKEVQIAKVDEISLLAQQHGFALSGFRAFEKAVTMEMIDRIRRNAFGPDRKPIFHPPLRVLSDRQPLNTASDI